MSLEILTLSVALLATSLFWPRRADPEEWAEDAVGDEEWTVAMLYFPTHL